MSTPYDGEIGMFHIAGRFASETTIDEIFAKLQTNCPNVNAFWLKTSDGTVSMGPKQPSKPDLAVRGVDDLKRWVKKATSAGYSLHAWSYLYGEDPLAEADVIAQACNVPGVKSMILDVEDGSDVNSFKGSKQDVTRFCQRLRANIPPGFHIGLCILPLNDHPNASHIDEWLPHIDSIHPQAYHQAFRHTPKSMIADSYANLLHYNKPIIPAVQAYDLGDHKEGVLTAAQTAVDDFGAKGVTIYRWGDTLKPGYFPFISQIRVPTPPVEQDHEPDEVEPEVNPDHAPEIETFEFTRLQLRDAFVAVATFLRQNFHEMLARAGLTDLDQRLDQNYTGFAIEHLPGLTRIEKALLDDAVNSRPLHEHPLHEHPVHEEHLGEDAEEDVFEFTCRQVKSAFATVAQALELNVQEMLASVGLTDLDQRLDENYRGRAIEDLPGLSLMVKNLLDDAVNSRPLPDSKSGEIAGKLTNQQVINLFEDAAIVLGRQSLFWEWAVAAGLEHMADSAATRNAPYAGPKITDLPNLSQEIIYALLWVIEERARDEIRNPPHDMPGSGAFLPIRWVSQLDPDNLFHACGPASLLMLGMAYGSAKVKSLTAMKRFIGIHGNTGRDTLINAALTSGALETEALPMFQDREKAVEAIRAKVQQGIPVIPLINYNRLTEMPFGEHRYLAKPGPNGHTGHWWVVIGTQGKDFIVHDPLWRNADNNGHGGSELPVTEAQMKRALDLTNEGLFLGFAPKKPLR